VRQGSTAFDLKRYLADERGLVEDALLRALEAVAPRVPSALLPALRQGLLSGGKRLRPVLCVAAFRACGGVAAPALYDLAVSPEMIHAYSLMHDDLPCMDDAPLRRGEPTPHRVHGVEAATRAGALLIPLAALRAWEAGRRLHPDPGVSRALVRELCRGAGAEGMVGGQVLDLLGEGQRLASEELDALHNRKTGALLTTSLRMGAVAAGADAARLEALDRYGRAIGLAFQVQDDVLDASADQEILGKAPSDAALGKSTYVGLHGIPEAERRARMLVAQALEALRQGGVESDALTGLAAYVVERDH
jgi:geranylgeranyl pyrophosphate synthase